MPIQHKYRQYVLIKDGPNGTQTTLTTWLKARDIKVGTVLTVIDKITKQESGPWTVDSIHGEMWGPPDPLQAIRKHRDHTGDSIRKSDVRAQS